MRSSREKNFSSSSAKGKPRSSGWPSTSAVKLRGEEIAVDHVAFQLGHVDAVGRKAAHCLVQRGGQICARGTQSFREQRANLGLAQFGSRASITKRVVLWASSSTSSAKMSRP